MLRYGRQSTSGGIRIMRHESIAVSVQSVNEIFENFKLNILINLAIH